MNDLTKFDYLKHIEQKGISGLGTYSMLVDGVLKLGENYSSISLLRRETIDDGYF